MADTDYKQNGATSIISMLGSIVAALGFEITDNAKAAVTMLKMQRDLMLDSTMRDYLTGQYTLKTLQNIATGAWYVPGKLVSWVQKWLANNGGYDTETFHYPIYTDKEKVMFANTSLDTVIAALKDSTKGVVDDYSGLYDIINTLSPDTSGKLFYVAVQKSRSGGISFFITVYNGPTDTVPGIDLNSPQICYKYSNSNIYVPYPAVTCNTDAYYKFGDNTPQVTRGQNSTEEWYLVPYDSGDKALRTFKLSNFGSIREFNAGGGITRGGGVSRHHYSLPKEENLPPCGGDTTVPQITEWSNRVINWNDDCYMPLTYFKVNPSNENPGTEPGSPNTPIEPDDPRLDPESPHYDPSIPGDILKYFYPEDYVQSTPQNGDNTVQTSGQLQDNYTNANNGPSNIPNTDIKGGLYTLWHPSADNLQKLGAFLYGSTTQGTIASIIGDPINAIIQLTEWAVTPVDGPVKSPVICNIGATELKMPTIPNQFMQFDCGTIEIPREYHDFRDYEPYTRLSLFLPFVGDVNISTNDCVTPHKIHVIYNIDFLSGVACAEVLIDEDVRYAYQAAMCAAVPVTSSDASRLIASIIGAAVGTVSGGVMGGIVGGTAGSRMASRALIGGVSEVAMSPINGIQTQRTGSISANTGLLGEMKPYVLVTRPISVVADQYKSLLGQPYQLDGTLGSRKGFVKVREVHLDGITATEAEKTEIEQMLKEGVIL
nr:MAG TPA: hypothetical protein [Caudoviricetes sp.]